MRKTPLTRVGYIHNLQINATPPLDRLRADDPAGRLRVGSDAYGVPIAEEIERTGGRRAALGAIYAALDRLERNGLVSSVLGEPTPERGGRAKRFFTVTPQGLRASRKHNVPSWRSGRMSRN